MKKKRRLWLRMLVVLVALLVTAGGLGWLHVKRQDLKYEQFRASGAGINQFLGRLARSVEIAVEEGDVDGLMEFYASDYTSPNRGHWVLGEAVESHGVRHYPLEIAGDVDGTRQTFELGSLRKEWSGYLSGIAVIDGATDNGQKLPSDHEERGLGIVCKINIAEEVVAGERARVTVKFILNGRDSGDHVLQDRFFFRWWLRSTGPGADEWEIVRDELLLDSEVSNLRVVSAEPGFERLDSEASGLVVQGEGKTVPYHHRRDPMLNAQRNDVELKFGVIQHAGGGVSACDYDGDGWVDLFFCDGVESRLFRNLGRSGTRPVFRDVTESTGLSGMGRVHSALLVDFDNDGIRDLFLARYESPCRLFFGRERSSEIIGKAEDGGIEFIDGGKATGVPMTEPCVSACALDYNRDGYVDIYVGVNGDAEKEVPRVPFFARNGEPNRLWRNIDGKRFEDVTEVAGVGDPGWSLAVASGDLDGDGWPDLVVANDFGRKNLYRNRGDGTFDECSKQAGTLDFSGGMGVAIGDLDGDGKMDLYTSNIYSNQRWLGEDVALGQYARNLLRSRWLFSDFGEYRDLYAITDGNWKALGKMAGEGNSLFINQCAPGQPWRFREARESCTNRAGWGWGVALMDIDNDSDLDIYAANGWITGKKADDL